MANTRMSAKNSFQEGLILDISPENMSATSMSSALNATLLTFNGNEMVLQNDMGNGRVETAFLPEGYVPVGTCEFGDIIYIVSYNPLINKSQIGCFPSPERNISTEELGGLGQILQSSDFQEINGGNPTGKLKATSVKKILYDNRDMTPGDKYIIYSEDLDRNSTNLSDYGNTSHTHDTFPKLVKIHVVSIEESGKIVYLDSTTRWYDNDYYLSNKGKKDNGKVDLDSYRDLLSSGYSIFSSKVSGKLALLVELEKITGFSCAWEAYVDPERQPEDENNTNYSIYMHYNWTTEHNDVNPDGVALLISEWSEINGTRGQYQKWSNTDKKFTLNQPINIGINLPQSSNTQRYKNGFTRHYSQESNISYSTYKSIKYDKRIEDYQDAYKLNINKTSGGIPIPGEYYINCTKLYEGSYYSGTNQIYPNSIDDSIVNNYFHYPIIKYFGDFTIPTKQTFNVDGEKIVKYPNINNLIYHYKIAPTMPYGILEEYAQEGYIDFSKLGKRHINLNTWKYYNYENTSTLTWGMEAYTEPNKGIQEIVFEFYDNNGFVAAYHTKDKLSYNGVFTEYLTLNESGTNYKLNNIKAFDSEPTYHKGLEVTKETAVPGFKYCPKNGETWIGFDELGEGDYYMDDSGTLYSNCLYLVKIIIKYCNKNILDEYIDLTSGEEAIIDYRWYWTNNMFNEYYYQEKDFANLQATLTLDGNAYYKQSDNFLIEQKDYKASDKYDNSIQLNNIYKSLSATVQYINQYGKNNNNIQMQLAGGLQNSYQTFNLDIDMLKYIDVSIYLANEYITNYPEQPELLYTGDDMQDITTQLYPQYPEILTGIVDNNTSKRYNELVGGIEGSGKELWEEEKSYLKYTNNFKLTVEEQGDKDQNLQYITSEGDYLETPISQDKFLQYNTNLENVYYNTNKYLGLTLRGVHLSKYCYVNKKQSSCLALRSFILDINDLSTYNLTVYNDKIHYNKILMTSNTDLAGATTVQQLFILDFIDKGPNNCSNFRQLEGARRDGEPNYAVQEGLKLNIDEIKSNFKFLFPIGYGYDDYNDRSASEVYKNGTGSKISNNKVVSTGYYSNLDLGGTLGAYDSYDNIEPGDHHNYNNSLTNFIPITLGYLTQLFYLTETEGSLFIPDNYIYLQDNYLSYKRDIVFKMHTKLGNELLLIRGMYYTQYLQNLINYIDSDYVMNMKNVNFNIESFQKNSPLEIQIPYIAPVSENINSVTLVQSVFEDLPKNSTKNYQYNTIYVWDDNKKDFEHLRSVYELKKLDNYSFDSNLIKAKIGENYTNFKLGTISTSNLLQISSDNSLEFKNLPSGSGSYKMKTHRKRWLTDYKSGLLYYK